MRNNITNTMRTVFFITFFHISTVFFGQFVYPMKTIEPAELVVTYTLNYQLDSLNSDNIRNEEMLLFIGKNVSLFLSSNSYFVENEMQKIKSQVQLQQWIDNTPSETIMSNFGFRIYKNYPAGKITYTEKVVPSLLKYETPLNMLSWTLSSDTATILGYQVQKATTDFGGRSWVAWFCSEIPYSDGPYKFNGLPGLILKIYDNKGYYSFELVSINKPNDETMITFAERQYIETTRQGFCKAKTSFQEDIISRVAAANTSEETQQNAARNMEKRNNPIELRCD